MIGMVRSGRPGIWQVAVVSALIGAAGGSAAWGQARELSEERWQERSYGLSLRPPLGTRMVSQTVDDYLLRLADEDGAFVVTLAVRRSRSELTLREVMETAKDQIIGAQAVSEIIGERELVLAERPAGLIYARVPQVRGREDVVLGQAMVQLDPFTYAVLELRSNVGEEAMAKPTFEAVLASLRMTDLERLNRERREALERGSAWRERLTLERLHGALIEEQTFRILRDDSDIGYMRVQQSRQTRNQKPGVEVEVRSRFMLPDGTIDSRAEFFLADDDTTETWSITTTRRPQGDQRPGGASGAQTFVETGIRTGREIQITTDGPQGQRKRELVRPSTGYLSQVEAWLLPQILPLDRPATYAFYCYNANEGKITFRTEQVVPALRGVTIESRLEPNAPALTARYDAEGRMIEKQIGPAQKQVPATPEEIARLWRGR